METEVQVKTKKPRVSTESLRVKRETKKRILAELAQINKKDFGRPVTPDDYVALAISLLSEAHIETLREKSLTPKDQFEKAYRSFCQLNGKTSKDEFLGFLLKQGGPKNA